MWKEKMAYHWQNLHPEGLGSLGGPEEDKSICIIYAFMHPALNVQSVVKEGEGSSQEKNVHVTENDVVALL